MLFDFETIPLQSRYKLLTSTIVPRPVAWVVSQDTDGRLNAAPFSFFNVFGQEPPVVVIGIGGRKPGDAKDTGNNIRQTGQFTVNLVSFPAIQAMNITAIEFDSGVNELEEAGLTTAPSTKVKPPCIADSPVSLECEQMALIDLNPTRTLVLGKILAMHVRDDCVLNAERAYIDTPKLDLVGRMHGAGWYVRTTDLVEVRRIKVEDWNESKKAGQQA
jgi:flavin reductase (DIM6/NTAB) family NADH-FMN oxidoreductase RutF